MGGMFRERGWEDREVKVSRKDLLAALIKNREAHIAEYKEACAGYRSQALARIDEIFADLKAKVSGLREGQTISMVGLSFGLNAPVSQEKAYDQIIRMMEMSVDEQILLTSGQFACFVMDDWDWKEEWAASNSGYTRRK